MCKKRKLLGYWTKERINQLTTKFKTRSEFKKNYRSAYAKALNEGWLYEVCKHMPNPRKNYNYWTKELVKKTYHELCINNNNTSVSSEIIKQNGYDTINNKIREYWGNKNSLDLELGVKLINIKWTKDLAKEVYLKLYNDNGGATVSNLAMYEAGYSTLPQKIVDYWVCKANLDQELGFTSLRKNWTKERVLDVYKDLCIKLGDRPATQRECREVSGLVNAILKFFGAKYEIDIELGYTPYSTNWTKEMVIEVYKGICVNNGNKATALPKSYKGGDIRKAVRKFFGTKENLDIEMGYTPTRITRTKESIIEEYRNLCIENGNKPITHNELSLIGNGLGYAINRKFGSKMELDSLLGYKAIKNFNWNKETIRETYHNLCIENGDKPITGTKLIEMGHNDLVTAFSRHYRKTDLDKDLGYDTITYWDKDLVKETYHNLCLENGDRPLTSNELKMLGHNTIWGSINKYFGSKVLLDDMLGYIGKNFYKLSNGIYVRSSYEVMLGNYLIQNNIHFEYDKLISNYGKYRYDFLVKNLEGNEVYIEIWGYDDKINSDNLNDRQKGYLETSKVKKKIYERGDKILMNLKGLIFKERSSKRIQKDLKEYLVKYNIKLSDFKILTTNELINSKNNTKWDKDLVKETYHKLCIENENKPVTTTKLTEILDS